MDWTALPVELFHVSLNDLLAPRFRFTLRDGLWLLVVAALAVCWWLDHRRHCQADDELTPRLKSGDVSFPMMLGSHICTTAAVPPR